MTDNAEKRAPSHGEGRLSPLPKPCLSRSSFSSTPLLSSVEEASRGAISVL